MQYQKTQYNSVMQITQAQVAESIGTSPSYVNKIVRNKEQIVNKTFLAMMEDLGYNVQLTYVKRNAAE